MGENKRARSIRPRINGLQSYLYSLANRVALATTPEKEIDYIVYKVCIWNTILLSLFLVFVYSHLVVVRSFAFESIVGRTYT
jgi:hypothetical protein